MRPLGAESDYPTPPVVWPVMLQRWHEIAFFHWSCEPPLLERRLPPGLRLDTFAGKAWISLTPFLLTGLRLPAFPRMLGLAFPEMNLRTYVVGSHGPGIWFFSLDAARLTAVAGARAIYGLPYYRAEMRVDIQADENSYVSRRSRANAKIRIRKETRIVDQSPLEIFLTARFRLYSIWCGKLIAAEVSHAPWELNRVHVDEFHETVRRTMGVEFPSRDFLAQHSVGVDTKIGRPKLASPVV